MIWGDPAQQAAASTAQRGAAEESKEDNDGSSGATFTGTVTPDMIVKEGWIYKRSRYLQQWKKYVNARSKFVIVFFLNHLKPQLLWL